MHTPGGVDIVQFSCPLYYVEEREDVCTVEVMRLGSLQGEVNVRFSTEDVSAKAGQRYEATSGKVTFLDGEARRVVQVAIIQKEDWCPTLEFKVRLSEPDNCYLGLYLQACNVKVIDDDVFPSDKYIDDICSDMEGVRNVNSYGLFWEFVKMNYQQEGIHWKTLVTLVFDQLKNANMYLKLSISAYLVNVVFHVNDETEGRLWVAHNREATATMVGLLYFMPMAILHIWDHIKIRMDLEGQTRVFISTCLFRKYLNYSEESRSDVAASEMQLGLLTESADLASGYTAFLDMAQQFGKLILMITFVAIKEPSAIILVLCMPTLISIFAYCRGSSIAEGRRERDKRERELIGIIAQTCEKYLTIRHYFRRSAREEMYRQKADQSRQSEMPVHVVQNNNLYASRWMGPVFAGLYICISAPLVIGGDIKLGFFLATISIVEDMSSLFLDVYERFQRITEIAEPLMTLSIYFNMPTDLRPFKKASEHELNWMHAARSEVMKRPPPPAEAKMMRTDLIPIVFEDLSFSYQDNVVCQNVDLNVKQGNIVGLAGNHGCGKATLLKLIGRLMVPNNGNIFIPPHLRILFVAQEPSILLDISLWGNLTMGCPDGIDPGLVTSILQEMGMERTLKALDYFRDESLGPPAENAANLPLEAEKSSQRDLLLGCDRASPSKGKSSKESKREADSRDARKKKELAQWFEKLNYTEKAKLHLARAMIMNPELMVMHRPLFHFDGAVGRKIMNLIKQHHKNRGLCMPLTTLNRRRPRTVFLTVEKEWQENATDIIWRLDSQTKRITEHRPKIADGGHFHPPGKQSPRESVGDRMVADPPENQGMHDKALSMSDWCFSPRPQSGAQGPIRTDPAFRSQYDKRPG